MKRFIERMDRGVRELQQKEKQQQHHQQQGSTNSSSSQEEGSTSSGKKEKSRWFGGKSSTSKKEKSSSEEGEELVEGLRVDQYLVVFLKFMSSIGEFGFYLLTKLDLVRCLSNLRRADLVPPFFFFLVPTIEVDSTTNIVSFCGSYFADVL